ncbi:MAG: copper chaperone PCu(A)C [Gammaproteobacteria bacterium]|jgi:copper(I)-binding protein|nr:copper chaperone PCu(A)C [Gammaproteobacteria bacterium]
MKKILAIVLLLVLLVSGWFWSVSMQPDTTLRIDHPRIRLLPGGGPLAGYFTIINAGDRDLRLLSASSNAFARIMIHKSVRHEGQSSMAEQADGVAIAAGARLEFAPGGLHLMLMQTKQTLSIGDEVLISLEFTDSQDATRSIAVPFTVVPVQAQ